ncbi:MAG: hypothetical protein A2381_10250 [Bdellovibrionales bacterium RIFOXYB1_FULL_37_110]|nr:MAG: hypothetical protein A2417_02765 [Bdellovibrionales bacterium RIFOXYC1_FULL_37_79]OFZ61145.1 MAG: hypothetical protein A2381_10250 [Bdellovibrionales bacterium RIFOXYB1_FULL_37_110]OFZ65596.1 MAG: hypothetical protein A2577_02435 [Bdellovibrionales bacterium RIFOXYD1_FULL_36_51]
MDYLSSILYGVIQGVTEFLPVSSSGHLALLPQVLKISDPGVSFDLSMHVGTALAVMIYFKRELWALTLGFGDFFKLKKKRDPQVVNLLFATMISFIAILFLKKIAFDFGRSPLVIAINLVVFGLLMWGVDKVYGKNCEQKIDQVIMWKASFFIGLMQALAIFPGVSRSGITITACRFFALSRQQSSRFSFLLSLPVIWGGFFFKLPELMESPTIDFINCLIGTGVSFVTGILAIHFFISTINRIGFGGFTLYRIILALIILLTLYN